MTVVRVRYDLADWKLPCSILFCILEYDAAAPAKLNIEPAAYAIPAAWVPKTPPTPRLDTPLLLQPTDPFVFLERNPTFGDDQRVVDKLPVVPCMRNLEAAFFMFAAVFLAVSKLSNLVNFVRFIVCTCSTAFYAIRVRCTFPKVSNTVLIAKIAAPNLTTDAVNVPTAT